MSLWCTCFLYTQWGEGGALWGRNQLIVLRVTGRTTLQDKQENICLLL